jgi:RNA polymerase sigma factor (sigma-70 family)
MSEYEDKNLQALVLNWKETKDKTIGDRIFNIVYSTIKHLAYKFSGDRFDDLVQEGFIAHTEALEKYNPEKGLYFGFMKTYVWYGFIKYSRQDYLIPRGSKSMHKTNLSMSPKPTCHSEIVALAKEKETSYKNVCRFACAGMSVLFDETQLSDKSDDVATNAEIMEDFSLLGESLSCLSDKNMNVVTSYFFEEKTLLAIAKENGVSRQAIHSRLNVSLQELKQFYNSGV